MGRHDWNEPDTPTNSRLVKHASSQIGMGVGLIAIISPMLALAGIWASNVTEIKALKTEQIAIRQKWEQDHDILVRISEQVQQIKEKVVPK